MDSVYIAPITYCRYPNFKILKFVLLINTIAAIANIKVKIFLT
jgi:hypothetical protein